MLKTLLGPREFSNPITEWKALSPQRRAEARAFYLSILPWLIGFLVFLAWPMLRSLYLSFTNYRLLTPPRFTGLNNLERLAHDELFWKSLKVTLIFVVGHVPIHTSIALIIAMVLAQKLRGVNFWRTIFFLPSVISTVAMAVMWSFVFNQDYGLLNTILAWFGIDGPGWLTSQKWALPSVIIMSWWVFGGQMVIYLAGLKAIPQVLYEAAEMDGAGPLAKFRYVTLPMLSPAIFFNVIMNIIGAFQVFDIAYVLTGGDPNNATLTYMLYLYRNAFEFTNMGYASMQAWVLFLIILALTLVVVRVSSRWVYYEAGD
jgi:multiple sugar transport system permease protein